MREEAGRYRSAALKEHLVRGALRLRGEGGMAGRSSNGDPSDRIRRAQIEDRAALMFRFPGLAHFPSMIDKDV